MVSISITVQANRPTRPKSKGDMTRKEVVYFGWGAGLLYSTSQEDGNMCHSPFTPSRMVTRTHMLSCRNRLWLTLFHGCHG